MKAATRNAMHSEQMNRRNVGAQRWGIVLLVLNFIGAVVYVVRASNGWVIPRERELGLHSVTGEPCLGFCCYTDLYDLLHGKFCLGWTHSCPPTVAKWIFVATHCAGLASRSGNRFRAPLTMIGETSPLTPL